MTEGTRLLVAALTTDGIVACFKQLLPDTDLCKGVNAPVSNNAVDNMS